MEEGPTTTSSLCCWTHLIVESAEAFMLYLDRVVLCSDRSGAWSVLCSSQKTINHFGALM